VFSILLILAIIAGVGSYGMISRRALESSKLKIDNERLMIENRRIIRVAKEVDQSRKILSQIIRSLGGHLDIGSPIIEDSLAFNDALYGHEIDLNNNGLLTGVSYAVERTIIYGMPTRMPVDGFISQKFFEDHLFPERSHRGIDIAGKTGASVVAAAAGRVVFAGWTPDYGNCLLIAHRGGYLTFYGHNQLNLKVVREEVQRAEPIALLGNSGRSSAPHLHFEIWKDGVPVDPLEFLQIDAEKKNI